MSTVEDLVAASIDLRVRGERLAHVLLEAGVIPGIDNPCRCDDCRMVAKEMAEAGYLNDCTDRWWEKENLPKA